MRSLNLKEINSKTFLEIRLAIAVKQGEVGGHRVDPDEQQTVFW